MVCRRHHNTLIDLRPVHEGFYLRGKAHAEDWRGEDNAVRINDLVVVDVHPVALDALVEFLARVAPPAGVDICLGERDLLNGNVDVARADADGSFVSFQCRNETLAVCLNL